MNNFKTTIGIEIHTVINTRSKMFSSSKNSHTDKVNTNINEIDLGFPGILPTVNKQGVIKAIQLAHALNMTVNQHLIFDRKNYFYQDLPKGFQITQQYEPIGSNGFVEIKTIEGKIKKINIERIHIEEDTAKQQTINGKIFLDYNRCGLPLIEIVSKPEINNDFEAMQYLKELKRILNFLEISDAKMEDGSLRADINISHNLHGENKLGTKVEIKNINSISNVGKAIKFEKDRQISLLLQGQIIKQQTLRWDDATNTTIFMRDKSDAVDYHYFTEPNIIQMYLSGGFINDAIKSTPNNLKEIYRFLEQLQIDQKIMDQLLNDYELYKVFNYAYKHLKNVNDVITWFLIELVSLVKNDNKSIENIEKQIIDYVIEMVKLLQGQSINAKQAKTIIGEIYFKKQEPKIIIERLGFKQITDPYIIEEILRKYINENASMVNQYNERPERVEKFLIGMLMKDTNGQANPNISYSVLKKLLTK